jgi:hypothetical protein
MGIVAAQGSGEGSYDRPLPLCKPRAPAVGDEETLPLQTSGGGGGHEEGHATAK